MIQVFAIFHAFLLWSKASYSIKLSDHNVCFLLCYNIDLMLFIFSSFLYFCNITLQIIKSCWDIKWKHGNNKMGKVRRERTSGYAYICMWMYQRSLSIYGSSLLLSVKKECVQFCKCSFMLFLYFPTENNMGWIDTQENTE